MQDNGGTANGGVDLDPTPNTITVNVTPVNDAPTGAEQDGHARCEDTAYTFTAADFGFSDPSDTPGQQRCSAVKITTLPAAGTPDRQRRGGHRRADSVALADITAGKLVFTPAANANGTATPASPSRCRTTAARANGGVDLDPTPNTMTVNVTAGQRRPERRRQDGDDATKTRPTRSRPPTSASPIRTTARPTALLAVQDHDAAGCRHADATTAVPVTAGQFVVG